MSRDFQLIKIREIKKVFIYKNTAINIIDCDKKISKIRNIYIYTSKMKVYNYNLSIYIYYGVATIYFQNEILRFI